MTRATLCVRYPITAEPGLKGAGARAINYAGPETYCDGTGNCATRNVTLTSGPGFDGLTGIGSVGPTFVRTMSRF